jgi:hypothetical protein
LWDLEPSLSDRPPPGRHIGHLWRVREEAFLISMKRIRVATAAVAIMTVVLTSASLAGPQSYCDSFAQQAANRKTGHAELITGTIGGAPAADSSQKASNPDEKWRSAYEASFAACVKNYEPTQETASNEDPAPKKAAKSRSRAKPSHHRRVRTAAVKKARAKAPRKPSPRRSVPATSIQSTAAPALQTNIEQPHAAKAKAPRKTSTRRVRSPSARRIPPAIVKSNIEQPHLPSEGTPQRPSNTSQQCRSLSCLLRR